MGALLESNNCQMTFTDGGILQSAVRKRFVLGEGTQVNANRATLHGMTPWAINGLHI
jgi:hypothetical protein